MNIENLPVISWTKANGLESLRTAGLLSKLNTPLAVLKSMLNCLSNPSFPGNVNVKFPKFWPLHQESLLSWSPSLSLVPSLFKHALPNLPADAVMMMARVTAGGACRTVEQPQRFPPPGNLT